MNKLTNQAALVLLIGSCILSWNVANGIFVREDEYDDSSERTNDSNKNNPQNFHEVDAFGDDYVDFGAHTGANGAFYWHANYPVEDHADYSDEDSRRK